MKRSELRGNVVFSRSKCSDVSAFFKLLEEQGESTSIRLGWRRSSGREPEWFFRPHTKMDGIVAMNSILQLFRVTAQCSIGTNYSNRIEGSVTPTTLYRFVRQQGAPAAGWKSLDLEVELPAGPRVSEALAWHICDAEQTSAIREIASGNLVSLNTYLLHTLQQAVSVDLDLSRGIPRWMIPVSMRQYYPESTNAVSYISVDIDAGLTVGDVHEQIKRKLSAGYQWAAWQAFRLVRSFGRPGLLAALDFSPQFTGIFSSFGNWTINSGSLEGAWVVCPPVNLMVPVAAGAIVWEGKLGLCLQAHPATTQNPDSVRSWMDRWVRQLLQPPRRQWFVLNAGAQ
jgi:hypothetical protein